MNEKGLLIHKHFTPKLYLALKNLFIYIALIGLWVWTVNMYAVFGTGWIKFAVALMWVAGAIAVWGIPEEREQTIKETKWAVFGYVLFLVLYRLVIVKFSQFSPDQVGVSLGVNVPVASATSALGFAQNILMIVSILTPVGFCLWVGQKFKVNQGRKKKDEAFSKYKGIRRNP
ncbi:hypothetical protein JK635_07895 [Neobacillus sp. YIM B02564]|uniref:Permease n=1 Tax=Neobacillus paridis TaxID=2803862 RepID=A0ABS1TLF1_9BACI|nr:hypothetical protein [Neobacillus paridis]MBL4952132.1 hypothetical protein [Neobacillus paridis]